mgnify:CR=1 FL=1
MKYDFENLFKRLLVMNHRGIYLQSADGHIWIKNDPESDYPLADELTNVMLNNKIYGGIVQAVDTFDEALRIQGLPSLLEMFDEDVLFMGRGGVDESRIDKVESGKGGMY